MGQVVFSPSSFKVAFPEFTATSDALLTQFFNCATLYLSNEDGSVVQDLTRREQLLWLLTAHVGVLRGALTPAGTAGGPSPVGRVSSASQGSVSASMDFPASPGAAWFNQTGYGAMFWQATLSLRSFNYRSRPTVVEGLYRGPGRW